MRLFKVGEQTHGQHKDFENVQLARVCPAIACATPRLVRLSTAGGSSRGGWPRSLTRFAPPVANGNVDPLALIGLPCGAPNDLVYVLGQCWVSKVFSHNCCELLALPLPLFFLSPFIRVLFLLVGSTGK